MPKKELEFHEVKAMKAPEKPIDYFDTIEKGLMLRHSKAGTKTFSYRYRFGGKNRNFKIGRFPDISLGEARKRVRELRQNVEDGIDPQAEKKKAKKPKQEYLFRELAKEFKNRHLPELRQKTRDEYKRIIDKELNPILGSLPSKEIGRKQIIELLDGIAIDRGKAVFSNRVRAVLSSIFTFGIDKAILEVNPVLSVKRKKKTKNGERVEKRRKRTYTTDELKALWKAFSVQPEPIRSLFFMLLLCAQRLGETRSMKWEYVDFKNQLWKIPASQTKAKREQIVPLSNQAILILQELREASKDSPYVFPNRRHNDKHIEWVQSAVYRVQELAIVDKEKKNYVDDFRVHDLRRTAATFMAKSGVRRTVLGKILNHKELAGDHGVTSIYDQHDYLEEKKEALQQWADFLTEIVDTNDE